MASSSKTATPEKSVASSKPVAVPKADEKKAFRHRPKQSYNIYIERLVKLIDKDAGLSGNAKAAACSMVENFLAQVFHQTKTLMAKSNGKKTVQDRDVESALKILHSIFDSKDFKSKLEKAKESYEAQTGAKKSTEEGTKSSRAGLAFPVPRIRTSMRLYRIGDRTSELAAVSAAFAVQELMKELLEEANEMRKGDKKEPLRLTAKHLKQAVDAEEFTHLFPGTFHNGGFREHIEPALVPKKSLKRTAEESEAPAPKKSKQSKKQSKK